MQSDLQQQLRKVAVVIIGRNEGLRLVGCFQSLLSQTDKIIYVDSGSTDDSVARAESLGVEVVQLDMNSPFTAARARNLGFDRLLSIHPEVDYVQFVDGDCQVSTGWLNTAVDFLEHQVDVAVVCGRRKEIHPERSIYNQLCDIEWNTPIGEAKACGGDALMRVKAVATVNGFRDDLIAGEEPELCVRLRKAGWRVWRVDAAMTLHDAAITKFRQWWKRSVRAGYAYSNGAYLHGAPPECHWVAEARRARLWGFFIPLVIFFLLLMKPVWGLCVLLIYPLQILRLVIKSVFPVKVALAQSFFLVLGKFSEFAGQLNFLWRNFTNKESKLIEYK